MRWQRTAVERRRDAPARAIKQPHAERMLQARDCPRYDGLRDGKVLGGFRHAPSLDRRQQHVHILQLESAANAILPLHLLSIAVWTYHSRKIEFDCYRNPRHPSTASYRKGHRGATLMAARISSLAS